jgi:hypothetical protein
MGGGDSHFVFCQKLLGEDRSVRRGVVIARSVLAKVRGDVFARLHAVAAKRRSRTQNAQFCLFESVFRATTTAV